VQFYAFSRQYPHFLFPGSTDKDMSTNPIREEGVENILDSLNPFTWWKVFTRIKKENSDLVILPWWVSFWTPQFWMIATLTKKYARAKLLFICHNVVEHESNSFDKTCTRFVLKRGDYFIVHSVEDLKNLSKIIPGANVKQSYHPTYEIFHGGLFSKEEARKKISCEGNILLFFGFVRPYKGLSYLIDAMPEIIRHIDAKLLIVGEFWKDEKKYREQIEKLEIGERILIIDKYVPNEEVGLYFAASDVAVLPYTSATGSGIVQTAFGCQKPVITTAVGCLPEVVTDGKTGFLVPPLDSSALADAVIRFYKDGKEVEFVKNIVNESAKFSWDRMRETIESFYT
jgi:glycosyltransferase involved in cell wall biosynthesis